MLVELRHALSVHENERMWPRVGMLLADKFTGVSQAIFFCFLSFFIFKVAFHCKYINEFYLYAKISFSTRYKSNVVVRS